MERIIRRALIVGGYLEDPVRICIEPEPLSLMQAVGAPLHEIAGLGNCLLGNCLADTRAA